MIITSNGTSKSVGFQLEMTSVPLKFQGPRLKADFHDQYFSSIFYFDKYIDYVIVTLKPDSQYIALKFRYCQ